MAEAFRCGLGAADPGPIHNLFYHSPGGGPAHSPKGLVIILMLPAPKMGFREQWNVKPG